MSPGSIGKSLFTEFVLRALRKQIRKDSKIMVDHEDIASALHEMLTIEAREQIGPMKIRRKRKPAKSNAPSIPTT